MLSNLCIDFMQFIRDNLVLCIILGVIAVLLIALLIVMIVLQVKAGKLAKACKAAEQENLEVAPAEEPVSEENAEEPVSEEEPAPAEQPAEATEEPEEAPAEEPKKVAKAPAEVKEEPKKVPAKSEEASAKEAAEETPAQPESDDDDFALEDEPRDEEEESDMKNDKTAPKKESRSPYVFKPAAKTEEAAAPAQAKASAANGKWVIGKDDRGRYEFKLIASNGEVMLESGTPYATFNSAKSGIKTYQDNIAAGRLEIDETKNGTFFVQILNARGGLLATSADYKSKSACQSAAESIKRWAQATVIEEAQDEE